MNKDIYILGASGFAKEVYGLARVTGKYKVKAFVDKAHGNPISIFNKEVPIISEEEFLDQYSPANSCLVMGIGDPRIIKKLAEKFRAFEFPNLIHPSAFIQEEEVIMGKGNIITAGVNMTVAIEIGDFNIFNLSVTVGHDVKVGNYNVINPSVNISGCVQIGNENLLGVGSVILQNKKIANNSIIGGASLVTKNVDHNLVVVGVPAKPLIK